MIEFRSVNFTICTQKVCCLFTEYVLRSYWLKCFGLWMRPSSLSSLWTLVELCWKTIWKHLPKWKCICSSILRDLLFGNTFVIKNTRLFKPENCKMFVEEDDEYNRILCGYFKKRFCISCHLKSMSWNKVCIVLFLIPEDVGRPLLIEMLPRVGSGSRPGSRDDERG